MRERQLCTCLLCLSFLFTNLFLFPSAKCYFCNWKHFFFLQSFLGDFSLPPTPMLWCHNIDEPSVCQTVCLIVHQLPLSMCAVCMCLCVCLTIWLTVGLFVCLILSATVTLSSKQLVCLPVSRTDIKDFYLIWLCLYFVFCFKKPKFFKLCLSLIQVCLFCVFYEKKQTLPVNLV